MTPGTRNDGLRLRTVGNADISFMRAVGTIAGAVVISVAARNANGAGKLIASSSGLAWQAPGSATPGPVVPMPVDGQYMLEDGTDASQWITVQAHVAWLGKSGEAAVNLVDAYSTIGTVGDDVTSGQAASGITSTVHLVLTNITPLTIVRVTAWLFCNQLEISSDNITFVAPLSINDPAALTWPAIAAGASVPIYIRRTIAASSSSSASVLNLLRYSWTGF